jgi:hypothetical protein
MNKELACTAIIEDVVVKSKATPPEVDAAAANAVVEGAVGALTDLEAADPGLTVATVGDSMIDYPMHRLAHAAFHVGPLSTWKAMRTEAPQKERHQHVVLVATEDGNLAHAALLDGTKRVLTRLRAALQAVRADASLSASERRAKAREAVLGVAQDLAHPGAY